MAKGDVVVKFDAQTAEFVQNALKAREALVATADAATRMGAQMKNAGDHAHGMMEKVKEGITEFAGMLALPTTIMAGFEGVMKAIESRIALAEERSRALAIRSATFESAMFTLGTQGSASEIRERLEKRTAQGFGALHPSPGQTESMYSQIVSAVGPRASAAQFEAAAVTGMEAMARGADASQAVQVGSSMAIIQAMAPNLSENEADQMARFFQANAPGVLQNERLLGAIARQKPENRLQAMRFAASMYQGMQPSKQAAPLMALVDSGRATFDRILEHPDTLPFNERAVARAVSQGQKNLKPVGSREEALAAFASGSDATSQAAVARKNAESAGELTLEANSSEDTIRGAKVKTAREILRKESPWLNAATFDFMLRAETATTPANDDPAIFNTPSDRARRDIDASMKMLREAQKQTELLQGIHSNTGGGPALNNDSEGQK